MAYGCKVLYGEPMRLKRRRVKADRKGKKDARRRSWEAERRRRRDYARSLR